jgi:Flp pilus assembly protein TadG
MKKFISSRSGIETIEAAITTPIAVLIMLATINLGMVIFGQQAVQAAARHGARMGSVAQSCPACYATRGAKEAIGAARLVQNPSVQVLAPGGVAGSILKVRVSGTIPNYLGGFIGWSAPFQVSSDVTFRQEGW